MAHFNEVPPKGKVVVSNGDIGLHPQDSLEQSCIGIELKDESGLCEFDSRYIDSTVVFVERKMVNHGQDYRMIFLSHVMPTKPKTDIFRHFGNVNMIWEYLHKVEEVDLIATTGTKILNNLYKRMGLSRIGSLDGHHIYMKSLHNQLSVQEMQQIYRMTGSIWSPACDSYKP